MNPEKLKDTRNENGYTVRFVADNLGISEDSYRKKEKGRVKFSDTEKIALSRTLKMTPSQFNDIFFDGKLPIGYADIADRSCEAFPAGNF